MRDVALELKNAVEQAAKDKAGVWYKDSEIAFSCGLDSNFFLWVLQRNLEKSTTPEARLLGRELSYLINKVRI